MVCMFVYHSVREQVIMFYFRQTRLQIIIEIE